MIKCMDIAVQELKKGEKASVICPTGKCHGEDGIPGKIPPNSTLKFDLELVDWGNKPSDLECMKNGEWRFAVHEDPHLIDQIE